MSSEAATEASPPEEEGAKSAQAPSGEQSIAEASADTPPFPPEGHTEGTQSRRVFVGNLSFHTSWQDLKDLMKSTGYDVTHADVITTADGRSKGCGIVEFATLEGAQNAILNLNGTELDGRQIFVREDRESKSASPSRHRQGGGFAVGRKFTSGEKSQSKRVYVGNCSWNVAWQDLKDHMRQAGEVVHAEIMTERSGRSKGCGIVEYATEEEAAEAIKTLNDTELKGRMIFVREDRETSSGPSMATAGSASRQQSASVYVWDLDHSVTWQQLKDHMRKAGNVDQATIHTDGSGKSIGSGVVVYQKANEAARSIRELDGSQLNGRVIHVREDRQHRAGFSSQRTGHHRARPHSGKTFGSDAGGDGTKLFVANLSFDTTWRELKDHFAKCGEIAFADVKMSATGKSRGFGTVRYAKKEDAEKAIQQLNGVELQGRQLEVRLDGKA